MTTWKMSARSAVLAMAVALTPVAGALAAGAQDYEFRLVTAEVRQGAGAAVAVRLVHKPSGRAVPDAVIYATRLDMSPEGMPTMTTPVTPMPGGDEPGVYRFRTDLVMAGGWALTLAAKVQGEEGTVQDRLVLRSVQ
ncbi:heavy metal RND transporter [Roseomonas sp. KE2513]|uniref:FixH family protein n=1 Tax=Roseomonas sp. KE2513 TaxID=2479202 RepID=UPI0018DEFE6C|nr:FixH family protein [Roseomonas sp. KE2513]MBI0537436.1 heavy metal RND transporter [Roseomonas sp. KE2513]